MKIELIDTHCHLDMEPFDSDRDEVVRRAIENGIEYIINISSDREGNIKCLEMSERFTNVYSTIGIHPHDAKTLDENLFNELKEWVKKPKVVAIGEIGLDYHYMHSTKDAQTGAFIKQLALARELSLPVIVHSREAGEETLKILKQSAAGLSGVMHCFSGDAVMAKNVIDMGFYISIAGPVTFKKADLLKEVVRIIPDERLLIETDAPFLSPVPMRGKRNEPAYVRYTAEAIAEIRSVTLEDIARITTLNAKRLFKIGDMPERGVIAYLIRDSLYLNITNRCTNRCGFCVKFHTNCVKGHNLHLEKEPSVEEIISAIGNPLFYKEVVFCGLGEPLLRLDAVKEVSKWLKGKGAKVRVNTNGHGNLIHGRNILPELKGLVDSISISLDAEDKEKYEKICRPQFKESFEGLISFIREAKKYIPEVNVTVVRIPEIDIGKCKKIADDLGVGLRIRSFNVVG
ncbi:MAG: YchF/TatD family DNA exonuclease [Nitrospirae bacterium]|nr:YchF/TatD family DNA exonuclease [Nitrospirota bacterium]